VSYGLRIRDPASGDFILKPGDFLTKFQVQGTLTFSGDQTHVVSIPGISAAGNYVVINTISVTGSPTPHSGTQHNARVMAVVSAGQVTFESVQSSGLTQNIGYTVFKR